MDAEFVAEPEHVDMLKSMQSEHFTPKELADLLGTSMEVIEAAAVRGELNAFWANHHIVDIRRHDVLEWLAKTRQ